MTGPAKGIGPGEQRHETQPGSDYRPPESVIVISEFRGQPWSTAYPSTTPWQAAAP